MWPKELARSQQRSAECFPCWERPRGDRAGKGISNRAGGAMERPAVCGQALIASNNTARPRLSPKSFLLLASAAQRLRSRRPRWRGQASAPPRERSENGARRGRATLRALEPRSGRRATGRCRPHPVLSPFGNGSAQDPKSGILPRRGVCQARGRTVATPPEPSAVLDRRAPLGLGGRGAPAATPQPGVAERDPGGVRGSPGAAASPAHRSSRGRACGAAARGGAG